MGSGLQMNFKTNGNVTVDCKSGMCTYAGLHEHKQQDGEGAAPLSSTLLSSCASAVPGLGLHRLSETSYHLKVNPALCEDKQGVGGERTR